MNMYNIPDPFKFKGAANSGEMRQSLPGVGIPVDAV